MTAEPEQIIDSAPSFPIPINEEARIFALRELKILDTLADERFDRLARLAAEHFKMPVVRITFVDRERTWFKATLGMKVRQAPRAISLCSHVIMNDDVMIVPDLTRDPRFANSPQVIGKPHFRFYAGAPIIISGGLRIGSVCLMDDHTHPNFTESDAKFLIDLAAIVVDELELHRISVDSDRRLDVAEPDGTVQVRFTCHDGGGLCLQIANTGEVIPEDKLDDVMQAFSQVNDELDRNHDGIGLGLPITKALAEMHGGRLMIESSETDGTILEVHFPVSRNRALEETSDRYQSESIECLTS